MTIDINELRMLAQAALAGPDGISLSWIKLLQDFQQEASPAVVIELLDRLEAAESARRDDYQNWMTALDRNAELLAKLEAAERDRATFIMEIGNLCTKVEALREELSKQQSLSQAAQQLAEVAQRRADALRAKVEQMEKQEPVAWMSSRNGFICKENKNSDYNVPLKRLDLGAQTQGEEK